MTEYTPGPWEVAKAYSMRDGKKVDEEWFVRRPEDDVAIASDIFDPDGPPYFNDVAQANAHLIAAAPQLLEACEAFVEAWDKSLQLEKTDVALRMARTAIAAAKGHCEPKPEEA